jgi:hypothetical protein
MTKKYINFVKILSGTLKKLKKKIDRQFNYLMTHVTIISICNWLVQQIVVSRRTFFLEEWQKMRLIAIKWFVIW